MGYIFWFSVRLKWVDGVVEGEANRLIRTQEKRGEISFVCFMWRKEHVVGHRCFFGINFLGF